MEKYIMSIDQGTTSSRAILFDHNAEIISSAQKEFKQYFPQPGWVEHDANEIWLSVLGVMTECVLNAGIDPSQVCGIGITNQRETTVVWNRDTGMPVYHAVVWQSRQTMDICESLIAQGKDEMVREKTGLRIDPYFSATKIRWILDHVENGQKMAEEGKLLAGTIDSWLIWCLTAGKVHVTDYTNASRTMLYNIYEKKWDEELCEMLNIPIQMMPEVKDSSCVYGKTVPYHFFGNEVPIGGVAGDQQAALFGQQCFNPGDAKNTYGTGCFLLMNTGSSPKKSQNNLVTTIAWGYQGEIQYALEGSVFVAGSAIQWLRDQLKFFEKSSQSEKFAESADPHSDVMVVPAFVGLGAPYWDDKCRGTIFGLTRGTSREDITKATLDSLCYQTRDVLDAMESDSDFAIQSLKVDGGASANNYMMQFQSDLLQCEIVRAQNVESTALGAAYLAGLAVGFWEDINHLPTTGGTSTCFTPQITQEEADCAYAKWQRAVKAARYFTNEDFSLD